MNLKKAAYEINKRGSADVRVEKADCRPQSILAVSVGKDGLPTAVSRF